MSRVYQFIFAVALFFCIQACTERAICPAYQSAFIHDKEVLIRKFSYFGEDSMPKVMEASKDKFLIIEPVSYRKKLRSLQTIPMRDVYPQEEDSTQFDDEFYLAERDPETSEDTLATSADSIYMISIKKEKFNIDQQLYLWYLRDYLVYPDVRIMQQKAAKVQEKKEKKGFFGFFKRLFSKKDKSDSTVFDVETSATELKDSDKKKKKKPFSFLKKKNKEKEKENPEEEKQSPALSPAQPNDEDDGEHDF